MDEKRQRQPKADREDGRRHLKSYASPVFGETKSLHKERGSRRPDSVAGGEFLSSSRKQDDGRKQIKSSESLDGPPRKVTDRGIKSPGLSISPTDVNRPLRSTSRAYEESRNVGTRHSNQSPSKFEPDPEKLRRYANTPLVPSKSLSSSPQPHLESMRKLSKSVTPGASASYHYSSSKASDARSEMSRHGDSEANSFDEIPKKFPSDRSSTSETSQKKGLFSMSLPEKVNPDVTKSVPGKTSSVDIHKKKQLSGRSPSADIFYQNLANVYISRSSPSAGHTSDRRRSLIDILYKYILCLLMICFLTQSNILNILA